MINERTGIPFEVDERIIEATAASGKEERFLNL